MYKRQPDRWCNNKVVVSPAYIERESVIGSYDGRHGERELCVNWEMELFRVNRNYKELVERLGVEMVYNYSEILPDVEAEVVAEVDDNVDELLTYLIMTDNTKGDRTIPDRDKLYDMVIWNDHINYKDMVEEYDNINNYYIDNNNIMYSIINDLYRLKIKWLFDDGG